MPEHFLSLDLCSLYLCGDIRSRRRKLVVGCTAGQGGVTLSLQGLWTTSMVFQSLVKPIGAAVGDPYLKKSAFFLGFPDAKDLGPALGASTLGGGPAILHCNSLGPLDFYLAPALHAVGLCHYTLPPFGFCVFAPSGAPA